MPVPPLLDRVARLVFGRAAACQGPTPALAGMRGSAMWQLPPSSSSGLEGTIVEGSAGTASGCTCAGRQWTPFAATWLPPVSMPPMCRSKYPKTGTRTGIARSTPALRNHGGAHIVGTTPARFPGVLHTLAAAVSPTAMDPTYPG